MNYLTEIKLFYDWLETHPLSANGIVLWHGVMQIASRSGWKNPIEIPSSLLETRTHLERTTIFRARSQLVEQGLLRIHNRGGRSPCCYTIVPFSQSVVLHSATQTATQNEEIPLISDKTKLNIVKKEDTKKKVVAGKPAPMPTHSKRKREKSSAQKEKTKRALFSTSEWLESIEEPWR